MPTEIRQIIFTREELLRALRVYWERRGEWPENVGLDRFTIAQEGEVSVELVIAMVGNTRMTKSATAADIGAALVLFCLQHEIPLPRSAKRSLQRFGDSLGLVLQSGP